MNTIYYLSYHNRIKFMDDIVQSITNTTNLQFFILSFCHYYFAFVVIFYFLTTNHKNIFLITYLIVIFIIIINFLDNGCIFMKLERKYIGKSWFGPYTAFNLVKQNCCNTQTLPYFFKPIAILSLLFGVFKYYYIII